MEIIKKIFDFLDKNEPIVSATILSQSGSTPRGAGTKMLIRKDGRIVGTIGGGKTEGHVIEKAPDLFVDPTPVIISFDLMGHGNYEDMDLICGGKMSVILERIDPIQENKDVFHAAKKLVENNQAAILTFVFKMGGDGAPSTFRFFDQRWKDRVRW